jgi:hypothetical protein
MTLTEWAERWPYRVTQHPSGAHVTPDTLDAPAGHRAAAFHLSDVVVSSVTAGSMWFSPRRRFVCEDCHESRPVTEMVHADGPGDVARFGHVAAVCSPCVRRHASTVASIE